MSKRATGILLLCLGIGTIIGAAVLMGSGISSMVKGFKPLVALTSPGEESIAIPQAGAYTLWHEHRSVHGGQTISHPPALPGGFTFTLIRDSDGSAFALDPTSSRSTYSTPSTESVEVGTFHPDQAGPHTLRVEATGGETRVFSLTHGNLLGGVATFGMRAVLAVILGLFGLVSLIVGIVLILLKPKPKPQQFQQPPPPPPLA